MLRQALRIDQKAYDVEHPIVAIRLSDIVMPLLAQGNLDEALLMMQRALRLFA